MPVAPTVSTVATTGLASPAVMTPDLARSSAVLPLVRPATPPPAMIASGHITAGGMSAITEALATTPAPTAAGPATTSSSVVHARDVVGQHLEDGGGAEHQQRRRAGEPLEAVGERQEAGARRDPGDQQRHEDAEACGGGKTDSQRDAEQRIPATRPLRVSRSAAGGPVA